MVLLWALLVVVVAAAVLMVIGQKKKSPLLVAIALSVTALASAALAAIYGLHHRYLSAAVFGLLAFTQGMSARRKWIGG